MLGAPASDRLRVHQVRAKTRQVVDHHRSDEHPGKPLFLLIPGGVLALASLALIVYLLYLTYYRQVLTPDHGLVFAGLSGGVYISSVGAFCYGYELYNWRQALRLTAAIVFFTLAAVIIVAVLFAALAAAANDKSSSRSSSGSSSSSSSSWWEKIFGSSGSSSSSRSPGSSTWSSSSTWSPKSPASAPLAPAPTSAAGAIAAFGLRPPPPPPSPSQCRICGAELPFESLHPDADGQVAPCPNCGVPALDPAAAQA